MIVVTGGAGFIGSALISKLNSREIFDILVVDNLSTTEKWKNISNKRITDYCHKSEFFSFLNNSSSAKKITSIIHLGACSSTTETDADYMMRNNFSYSKELAKWALSNNIRFIYASSAATYGDGGDGFSDSLDSTLNLKPLNIYAFSKQLFDLWVYENKVLDKMVGLKFFNVFGPNEYHKGSMTSVVYNSFKQIKEKGSVNLFKSDKEEYQDGEQMRDFIYVKDCSEVISWFLDNKEANGIFNLGFGKARTWNDLVIAVFRALDLEPKINYIDLPDKLKGKYQYFTEAKMDKLRSVGCKLSFHSLEDGVKDYVSGYLSQDFKVL